MFSVNLLFDVDEISKTPKPSQARLLDETMSLRETSSVVMFPADDQNVTSDHGKPNKFTPKSYEAIGQ